jgi:hypothetical protein
MHRSGGAYSALTGHDDEIANQVNIDETVKSPEDAVFSIRNSIISIA